MKLVDLLDCVGGSSASDWHKFETQIVYGWEYGNRTVDNVLVPYIKPKTHDTLAVFKPDVDISLVCGATVVDDFSESWCQTFPDPHARSLAVVLRYRGSPVYEWVFVSVDGGRYLLPMPHTVAAGKYNLAASEIPFARLIFELFGVGRATLTIEDTLRRAGIDIA